MTSKTASAIAFFAAGWATCGALRAIITDPFDTVSAIGLVISADAR